MNIFRIAGDSSHILAILLVLYKLLKTKSAAGLSGKSQILYATVFMTRYNDLFSNFISLYNTLAKISFISVTLFFVYLIFFRYRKTYERTLDTCKFICLEIVCLLLAFFYNYKFTDSEVAWAFSIYLEAVALLPQMVFINKAGRAETYVIHYMLLIAFYRLLYIGNWTYRYLEEGHYDIIAYRSGLIQTLLNFGFLTYYALYIKGKSETKHNYSANISEYLSSEKLLKNEKPSSDIPSVFVIGSKKSYEYPDKLDQATA